MAKSSYYRLIALFCDFWLRNRVLPSSQSICNSHLLVSSDSDHCWGDAVPSVALCKPAGVPQTPRELILGISCHYCVDFNAIGCFQSDRGHVPARQSRGPAMGVDRKHWGAVPEALCQSLSYPRTIRGLSADLSADTSECAHFEFRKQLKGRPRPGNFSRVFGETRGGG